MLRITELRLPLDHAQAALRAAILARLQIADSALKHFTVFRRAWDARKKSAVVLSYTVDCEVEDEAGVLARLTGDRHIRSSPDISYRFAGRLLK
ncbi:MAG TPA: hypothetical protein VK439_14615, partial [Rubrivivax sp.]|nr:hypothetical protein [Rubrivivax sp.]